MQIYGLRQRQPGQRAILGALFSEVAAVDQYLVGVLNAEVHDRQFLRPGPEGHGVPAQLDSRHSDMGVEFATLLPKPHFTESVVESSLHNRQATGGVLYVRPDHTWRAPLGRLAAQADDVEVEGLHVAGDGFAHRTQLRKLRVVEGTGERKSYVKILSLDPINDIVGGVFVLKASLCLFETIKNLVVQIQREKSSSAHL